MEKDEARLRLHAFLMELCHLCHEHRLCISGAGTIEFYLPEKHDCCFIPARFDAGPTVASASLGNDGKWLEVMYKHLYHRRSIERT